MLRSLWRGKVFAITAVIAFVFGIGATATVFSVVDTILLHPVTFREAGALAQIQGARKGEEWDNVPPAVYEAVRARGDLFSAVAAVRTALFTVTHVPEPDQVFGLEVSANFFRQLSGKPMMGRLFTPGDDTVRSAVLSYKAWRQLLHGAPDVVGKTIQVDGQGYTIIGVMPQEFALPPPRSGTMMWTTLAPGGRGLAVLARLRLGVTLPVVQRALDDISTTMSPLRLRASRLSDETDSNQRTILWTVMGMVSGLLLIGCANLASLLLARSIARRKDFAIRLATGASRWQLIQQALTEVLLLALVSLPIACVAANAGLAAIRTLPHLEQVELNGRSLLFAFGVALLSSLLCGLFPALFSTRIDLSAGLREAGNTADGRRSAHRFLHSLLALEAGISIVLLLTSGLLVRSLARMINEDRGLKPDHVLTLRLPTGSWGRNTRTPEVQRARYLETLERVRTTPGVAAAALASSLPLSNVLVRSSLEKPDDQTQTMSPVAQAVTPDYFRVMGIPMLAGQTFPSGTSQSVAIVNEAFAREYFHGDDPVGRTLFHGEKESSKIIGMVKDSPALDLTEKIEPEIYWDFEQTTLTPFLTGLVVRTHGDVYGVGRSLRKTLELNDAEQPVVQVKTLKTLIDQNVWQPKFAAWLTSLFAGLALCLCSIGIYGVVAYVTTARKRDFGIRVALGAERGNLLRLAARQSLLPLAVGSGLGLLAFYWVSRWIESLLYRTSPLDASNALSGMGTLLAVSLAAIAWPVWRAAKADPAITLRHE